MSISFPSTILPLISLSYFWSCFDPLLSSLLCPPWFLSMTFFPQLEDRRHSVAKRGSPFQGTVLWLDVESHGRTSLKRDWYALLCKQASCASEVSAPFCEHLPELICVRWQPCGGAWFSQSLQVFGTLQPHHGLWFIRLTHYSLSTLTSHGIVHFHRTVARCLFLHQTISKLEEF